MELEVRSIVYAIIDIETTGGQYNQEGITEIAIYKFDGTEIVDQFISLVNPEIPIQPFVVKLTGINQAMLRLAPKFYEIAKRIIEITEGCVIVAHNASFDYRILRMEFKRLGYDFHSPTLCTVELSKRLLPEVKSYSLGKLVRSLGIPIADRHRASGDAIATLKLFKLLLAKDQSKSIVRELIQSEITTGFSPKLFDILEPLPSSVGIFYIHNDKGDIIYIAKSNNIRKKVSQLFTGISKTCKRIQNEVFTVTFEETGNDLIASLKEREEILVNKPVLNVTQRRSIFLWGVYQDIINDKIELKIAKIDGRKKALSSFKNQKNAIEFINYIQNYHLTDDIYSSDENKLDPQQQLMQNIQSYHNDHSNLIIVLKGRKIDEKSAVVIENGVFKGYCFFDLNYQINTPEVLKKILIPLTQTKDALNIIKYYIYHKKDYRLIRY